MAVTDLQSWADNLELVRLPGIDAALVDLDTRQSAIELDWIAKAQQWTDALDAHTAQISAAQADADLAQAESADTTTRVYGQEIILKTYVDQQIQLLRNNISTDFAAVDAYLNGDLQAYIDNAVATNLPTLQAELQAKLIEAEGLVTQLQQDLTDINSVNNTITNIQLPAISVETGELRTDIDSVTNDFSAMFTDYPYVNVVDGLNDTRSLIAGEMQSLGHKVPRLPQSNWTTESNTTQLSPKAPPLPAQFVTDDTVFGDCVEFSDGIEESIGQSYPVDYAPDRVYKITARFRVVSDGTLSGVQLALGATTWNSDTLVDQAIEKTLTTNNVTVANGEMTFSCYFSGDLTSLQNAGHSVGPDPLSNAVHLPGSPANKVFFYLKQNVGGATDGQIRMALLDVVEVTDVTAESTIRQDAIATIDGKLAAGIMLRAKAGTGGAELELVAASDPENGSASLARISADDIVLDGTVTTSHLSADVLLADNIVAGVMSVNRIYVDDVLSIDEANGGFSIGKPDAYDQTVDGVYMGRTLEPDLSTGFGLAATKTDPNTNLKQHFELTEQNGLRFTNAQFARNLNVPGLPTTYTQNTTIALDPATNILELALMGGGGGGSSAAGGFFAVGAGQGQTGGTTTVKLYDGATLIETWTAAGGAGGNSSIYSNRGQSGFSSKWGTGGLGGLSRVAGTYCGGYENEQCGYEVRQYAQAGFNATGYGSGGGGGGLNWDTTSYFAYNGRGGAAAALVQITNYDISGLTNPSLVITIGAGGAGGTTYTMAGGAGSPGRVDVIEMASAGTAADVIPITPQFIGTFDSGSPFPDLGAGFWHLASTGTQLNLGLVSYNDLMSMRLHEDNSATFISDRTPTKTSFVAGQTIRYMFYKMGQ